MFLHLNCIASFHVNNEVIFEFTFEFDDIWVFPVVYFCSLTHSLLLVVAVSLSLFLLFSISSCALLALLTSAASIAPKSFFWLWVYVGSTLLNHSRYPCLPFCSFIFFFYLYFNLAIIPNLILAHLSYD